MPTTRSRAASKRRGAADRERYVALLRAVNVGGRGIVKKEALREAFARAGGAHVRTFIASGNVLFEAAPDRVDAIVARARRRLKTVLGTEPVVMVMSASEIAASASGSVGRAGVSSSCRRRSALPRAMEASSKSV